nr:MAG TPA: hypothetical protein [Caudoviricetes sp.]
MAALVNVGLLSSQAVKNKTTKQVIKNKHFFIHLDI